MLVLTRKKAESILIAGDIVVTILDVRGDRVRVGIEAPREVPITRSGAREYRYSMRPQPSLRRPLDCVPL